jgi:hypothetical protein
MVFLSIVTKLQKALFIAPSFDVRASSLHLFSPDRPALASTRYRLDSAAPKRPQYALKETLCPYMTFAMHAESKASHHSRKG